MITVSIVSHSQRDFIEILLNDLVFYENINKIIITINVPESDYEVPKQINHKVIFIRNKHKKGFGANHNSAFKLCETNFFLVLNPDIRIHNLDFIELINEFRDRRVALVAPQVVNVTGELEDNCRDFPTFFSLLKKIFIKPNVQGFDVPSNVDWVAGMFMLLDVTKFRKMKGFDSNRFFMYYEDVDLCFRIKNSGYKVIFNPNVKVVHEARRESRRKIKYMKWHLYSMFRYLTGL